jgi:membrane protease subunit (stomatin/prohibitin family)
MAIIDRVKWSGSQGSIAWKFPSEELSTWTQLIVNESQEAFLVRGGVYEGPFGAGRHTLSTENIPLIRELFGIPFGGKSPFSAEVWFVNRVTVLDIRWGTPDPIQLQDPKFKVMVPVRAFGQYGIRISDSKKFLLNIVGALGGFDVERLTEYLRGIFVTKIMNEIANAIVNDGISVFEISTRLEQVSQAIKNSLSGAVAEYGVELAQFNIHSISMPENDPAVVSLKAALAKKAAMGIIGFDYQQERSFDVMQAAAANEGSAGGVMGAGMGLGMGAAMGVPLGSAFGQIAPHLQPSGAQGVGHRDAPTESGAATAYDEKIRLLKQLAELKTSGILSDEEFQSEKKKILGG